MLNVYASNDRFYRLVYIVKRFLFAFYRFWALGFNLLSQSRPSPHFSLSSLHPPVSFSFFSLSVSFALTVASYRRRFRFLSPPPLSLSFSLPCFVYPHPFSLNIFAFFLLPFERRCYLKPCTSSFISTLPPPKAQWNIFRHQ